MIASIDIAGVHYDVNKATRRYVLRKIAKLERFLPAHARKSASADVKLKQIDKGHGNKYEAEIVINVPDKRIVAKDSTVNMMAAIDIVEAKLANQLQKYKDSTLPHVGRRRLLSRIRAVR